MLIEILLFILFVFTLIYWYVTKHFGFFKRHGVLEDPPSFPFGSECARKVFTGKESAINSFKDHQGRFTNERYWGMYTFGQRNLVVTDVELGKLITIRDADHFVDRTPFGVPYTELKDELDKIFAMFLSNMTGDEWKKMRNMSTPVFTSGKLRLMVPHIARVGANLEEMLGETARAGDVLDAKELFGKFALDAIASSSFGIESNSFKEPESLFRINAMKLTRDPKYAKITDIPKFMFMFIAPRIAVKLGMNFLDKKCGMFFVDIVRKTIQHRRETGARRNDVIDIFMHELDKNDGKVFSQEDLELGFVSTSLLFFFAGFDTTSTTLSVVLHGLIHHPEVQERVRKEIEDIIGDEEINADHLKELKYTENVIHEAMRKYFRFGIQRICTRDYKIPDSDFTIPKDLMVTIMPREEDCFPNPEKFDPDNFEESEGLNKFGDVGFGQGPRNCIGMRYALQALKIAIIHTVRKYKLVTCDLTNAEDKLFFSVAQNGFVGGIKFKVESL